MHTPGLARPSIGSLCLRTATLADHLPVQAIAGPAMREFGLTPDFDTLDRARGGFGAGLAMAEPVAERIGLDTWSHMTAAVHLYQSFGWRQVEWLDPASGSEWGYELVLDGAPVQGTVASPQKQ